MKHKDTASIVLDAVKAGGLLGVTSLEITDTTGVTNNRVTAALTRLTEIGCVRRDKIFGFACRFRYYFIRDDVPMPTVIDVPVTRRTDALPAVRENPPPMPPVKPPRVVRTGKPQSGASIALAVNGRIHYVGIREARGVYRQLASIFGN